MIRSRGVRILRVNTVLSNFWVGMELSDYCRVLSSVAGNKVVIEIIASDMALFSNEKLFIFYLFLLENISRVERKTIVTQTYF